MRKRKRLRKKSNCNLNSEELNKFIPGDLVEILTDRTASEDGLTTAHACENGGLQLYAEVLMENYPSFNDFVGPTVKCMPQQTANIVRYVGRPHKIRSDDRLWEYDIYEVLVNGYSAQVFAVNLKLIGKA